MKVRVFLIVMMLASMAVSGFASDAYFIVIDGNPQSSLQALFAYPGRYWGLTGDRLYLYGNAGDLDWLNQYQIQFRATPYELESTSLYLSYINPVTPITGDILDTGQDYVISDRPISGALSIRQLTLKQIPARNDMEIQEPNTALIYNAGIDSLIGMVDQDTILSYLAKLSGAAPININGGLDTIKTRFSGTSDNNLAAQWLKGIFEGCGYQTSYHNYYSGTARDVAVYDANRAWVVTESSEALRTTDGGQTWITMPDNTPSALWGVDNAGPDSVWLSGYNGVVRFSSNGGATFTSQSPGYNGYLFGMDFNNSREGWIAADIGIVVHTTDGGSHWNRLTTSTDSRLYDVCFVDSLYGWAVGRDGVITHTTDGGQSWSNQVSNTLERLYSVDFINLYTGWATGWNGVVLVTFDGGANWEIDNLHNQIEKYHVDFTDMMHGCIVGWEGTIYRTTDGGSNWHQVTSGTTRDLYGVDFYDNLNGVAVGDGIILKTIDGGETWSDQTAGVESSAHNVIATKPGTLRPGQQMILCAHYDNTSEQPLIRATGADDNGSGVVGVLEAARLFQNMAFEKTIKFCLWTGEEQGLLGSAAYAADAVALGDSIAGVYNYDMIAYDGNNDGAIELHCGTMPTSLVLGNIFENVLDDYDIFMLPELLTWNSTDRSDHASFWEYNIPAMLGIEDFSSDFNPYYHTIRDNMTHIDHDFFLGFTKALVGAAVSFAVIDSAYMSVDDNSALPDGFTLRQNYPNPFNAQTSISFYLPERSDVALDIFDILGRKVTALHNGVMNAGNHSIIWDAAEYASGIYFYRLQAGLQSAVGRMVLEK